MYVRMLVCVYCDVMKIAGLGHKVARGDMQRIGTFRVCTWTELSAHMALVVATMQLPVSSKCHFRC